MWAVVSRSVENRFPGLLIVSPPCRTFMRQRSGALVCGVSVNIQILATNLAQP